MSRIKLSNNQAGDTIVEVLIALAVLALVLGGASVLASKSYKSLQNTQERSSAQRLAQSQLEFFKEYAADNPTKLDSLPAAFCMAKVGTAREPVVSTSSVCAKVDAAGEPTIDFPNYKLEMTTSVDNNALNIKAKVIWTDLSGAIDSNDLVYRIYKKDFTVVAPAPTPPAPPPVPAPPLPPGGPGECWEDDNGMWWQWPSSTVPCFGGVGGGVGGMPGTTN